jgi:hypothetical protein
MFRSVDGHDPDAIAAAIEKARKSAKPSLIACRTTIGKGAPTMQGSHKTHGAPLGKEKSQGLAKHSIGPMSLSRSCRYQGRLGGHGGARPASPQAMARAPCRSPQCGCL